MSYRNRHQSHRADQVWNRDIRHSDEEDWRPRTAATGYSPGYSNRQGFYSNSYPEGYDRGDSALRYSGQNSYRNEGRDYDRYDNDRWNDNRDRYNSYRLNDAGRYYDYESGELRDHSAYDRNRYSQTYDRYDSNRYDTDHNRFHSDNDRGWWDRSKDEVRSWFGDSDAQRRREQDAVTNHRGKGPKGYQRSDDRIREDVSDRLSDDDRVDASEIEVEVNSGEVILKGSVISREEKRRAEDIAERVSGVRNVENRLRCTPERLMNRYTGTTGDFTGIGSSSGTTSEVMRDVRNSQ